MNPIDKYSLTEDDDDWDDDDDFEPEEVEEIGDLRLDPEAAKRYWEVVRARQKADGPNFPNESNFN